MASYKKLEDGRYKVRWRDPDGKQRSKVVRSAAAAKRIRREVEECEDEGKVWVDPRDRHRSEGDLGELIEQYIRFHGHWSPQTVASVRSIVGNSFLGWCERDTSVGRARRLSTIRLSERHVLRWRDELAVNPTTQKNYLGHVRRFWEWVESRRPGEIARPPRVIPPLLRSDGGDFDDSDVVPPTWEQMDLVLFELRTEWLRRLGWICRCQGVRISQALRLQWTDVDLKNGGVRFRKGRGTKRSATRVAPLADALRREMRTWLPTGPNVVGHRPNYIPNVSLRRAWKRTGLPREIWDGHTSHAFRKGVIDGLDTIGVHPQAIADFVGHKFAEGEGALPRVAQKHYQRSRLWGRMLEAANAIPPVGGPYPAPRWEAEMPQFEFGS